MNSCLSSRHQMVKALLLRGETVTPISAMIELGVTRLAPIIHRLRVNDKMKIKTDIRRSKVDGRTYGAYHI